MISRARHYLAYGLRIRSEIDIPLSPAAEGEPDVTIRIGAVSEAPESDGRPWRTVAPGAFLLNVDEVARYLVTGGRDIVVEPAGGDDGAVSAFLLGSVLAACLQQRGILTLHASAVETDAGAVLFAGRSGDGKSTLLAALVKRGYTMLADDVTGVVLDPRGRAVALPAFPCVRLWADAMDRLDWRRLAGGKTRAGLEKYLVPVERIRDTPLAVRAVCVLASRPRDRVEIETPPPAAAAFRRLLEHVYRRRYAQALGRQREQFRGLAAMARQVPVHRVTRPAHPFLIDALADGVEGWLRGSAAAGSE